MSKIRSDFPQTPLNLTLREEQISTILYCLEGYVAGLDDVVTQDENDKELLEEVDEIFEVLETTVDKFYNKIENCLLYTSPSPRDKRQCRMPSSA